MNSQRREKMFGKDANFGKYKGTGIAEKFKDGTTNKRIKEKITNVVVGVLYQGSKTVGICVYNVNKEKLSKLTSTTEMKKIYKKGNFPITNASFNFYVTKKVLFTIGEQKQYPCIIIKDAKTKEWEIEKGIIIYDTKPVKDGKAVGYKAIRIENREKIGAITYKIEDLKKFYETGNYKCNYEFDKKGKIVINETSPEENEMTVEEVSNTKQVLEEAANAFYKVNLQGNMVKIRDCDVKVWNCREGINGIDGFAGSEIIEKVDLSGCEKVLSNAFKGCKNLSEVKFSNTLKEIQSGAFANCRKLRELHIPESCDKISDNIYSSGDVYLYRTTKTSKLGSFGANVKIHIIGEEVKENVKAEGRVVVEINKNGAVGYDIINKNGEIKTARCEIDKTDLLVDEDLINFDSKTNKIYGKDGDIIIIGRAGLNYVIINKDGDIKLATYGDLIKKDIKLANGKIINDKKDEEEGGAREIIQANGKDWLKFKLSKDTKEKIERITGVNRGKRITGILSALSNVYGSFSTQQMEALNQFYAYKINQLIVNKSIVMSALTQELKDNYPGITWRLAGWRVGGHPDSDNKYGVEKCCYGHATTYHWVAEGINNNKEVEALLTFGSNCICNFMGIDKNDFDRIKAFEDIAKGEMEYLNKVVADGKEKNEKEKLRLAYEIIEKINKEGKLDEVMGEIAPHIRNFDKFDMIYTSSLLREIAIKLSGRNPYTMKDYDYVFDNNLRSLKTLEIILDNNVKETIRKIYSNPMAEIGAEHLKNQFHHIKVRDAAMFFEYALGYDIFKKSSRRDSQNKLITEESVIEKIYEQKDKDTGIRKGYAVIKNREKWLVFGYKEATCLKDLNEYAKNLKDVAKGFKKEDSNFYNEWNDLGLKFGEYALNNKFYVNTSDFCADVKINEQYLSYNIKYHTMKDNKEVWKEFLNAIKQDNKRPSKGNIKEENRRLDTLDRYKEKMQWEILSPQKIGIVARKALYYSGRADYLVMMIGNGEDMFNPYKGYKQKIVVDNKPFYEALFANYSPFTESNVNGNNIYFMIIEDKEFNEGEGLNILNKKKTQVKQSDITEFINKHIDEIRKRIEEQEQEYSKKWEKELYKELDNEISKILNSIKDVKIPYITATDLKGHTIIEKDYILLGNGKVVYDKENKKYYLSKKIMEELKLQNPDISEIVSHLGINNSDYPVTVFLQENILKSNKKIKDFIDNENLYNSTCIKYTTEGFNKEIFDRMSNERIANSSQKGIWFKEKNGKPDYNNAIVIGKNKENNIYGIYGGELAFLNNYIDNTKSFFNEELCKKIYETTRNNINIADVNFKETNEIDEFKNWEKTIEKAYSDLKAKEQQNAEEEKKKETEKVEKQKKTNEKKERIMTLKEINNNVYTYLGGRHGFKTNETKAYVKDGHIIVLANEKDCVDYAKGVVLVKDGVSINNYDATKCKDLIRGSKIIIIEKAIQLTDEKGRVEIIDKKIFDLFIEEYKKKITDTEGLTIDDKFEILKGALGTIDNWANPAYKNAYKDIISKYDNAKSLTSNQSKSIEYAYDQYKRYAAI